MVTIRNPEGRPAPEHYHHGVEVSGPVRTLYVSGQIGVAADGTVPEGIEAQARLVYANMKLVLAEAGMDFSNLVKSTVFLVNREDRAAFAAVRAEATGGIKTASTLVFISGLVLPELLVEVEAIAVKAT
jgi:enamine deaminase RidA (YjgF/YER057c/UK114 family)